MIALYVLQNFSLATFDDIGRLDTVLRTENQTLQQLWEDATFGVEDYGIQYVYSFTTGNWSSAKVRVRSEVEPRDTYHKTLFFHRKALSHQMPTADVFA